MIVMPSNSSGWFWHSLARETGKLGHLFSPGGQRGPWPWLPYALDNGAFACWDAMSNTFDETKWAGTEIEWARLLLWATENQQKPLWVLVPDVPGNAARTLERYALYAPLVSALGFTLAVAAQDGMSFADVRSLAIQPEVVFIGGSTEWKWSTAESWSKEFPRVHIGRVNSPTKLPLLESWGVESCDGTGWNRGDTKQTSGLECWCRSNAQNADTTPLWPFVCNGSARRKVPPQPVAGEELL